MGRFRRTTTSLLTIMFSVAVQAQLTIFIWYGDNQKIGHLGHARQDFNLLGNVLPAQRISSLGYSINDGPEIPLSWKQGRRIAALGDFNADIAIGSLDTGSNRVTIHARDMQGALFSKVVNVYKSTQGTLSPTFIAWSAVSDPQDVGQYVDGFWEKTPRGLRIMRTGYERTFLIGTTAWRDYQITVPVTVHSVDPATPSGSGSPGVGLAVRFAGHEVQGHARWFSGAQPKYGYLPFGALCRLRWRSGASSPPTICFHRGDSDTEIPFALFPMYPNVQYVMKMKVETLPDSAGMGVSRYSFKVWNHRLTEPEDWNFPLRQESRFALRTGGAALTAHHVAVTFGDILIEDLVTVDGKTHSGGPSTDRRRRMVVAGHSVLYTNAQSLSSVEVYDIRGHRLEHKTRKKVISAGARHFRPKGLDTPALDTIVHR